MSSSVKRFEKITVIVTGAGSGIGAATARRFAADGANVVLAGRTRAKLEATARTLDADRTLICESDVSVEADAIRLARVAIERFGGIDVLVNNAGVGGFGPFEQLAAAEWRRIMATDLDGTFYVTRAAIESLLERKGAIVNVSSVSGLGGDWGGSAYNAAKGGVTNLTRALALEFGSRGVRVNAVAPSLTKTDMTDGMLDDAMLAKFAERMPMGRAAEPGEVADVIGFLASRDARFVTGAIVPVDGGLSASNGQPNMS